MRGGARLEVWQSDGRLLCADPTPPAMASSEHLQSHAFAAHCAPGGELRACYTVDDARDAEMGTRWAWAPALVTLGAGAAVAAGASWHVRRQLRPLNVLAAQTRSISPRRLDQRLALADPAEELRP
jgi:two-component system heavy metal sensor histidine kinase CusS